MANGFWNGLSDDEKKAIEDAEAKAKAFNDAGVLQTADQGASWQVLGLGMPAVEVVSLALDSTVTPEVLRAGSFGRSVFELAGCGKTSVSQSII